jgi:hypothetical protein
MVDHSTSPPSPWRSLRPVVQAAVIAMWMVAGLTVGACACGVVAFWDLVPFDEPGRPHVGEHVYAIIGSSGIGLGFVSGLWLCPRSGRRATAERRD